MSPACAFKYIKPVKSYEGPAKTHLGRYRRARLGVRERGSPRGKTDLYSHILPEKLSKLNILEGYRAEFFEWHKNRISLHRGFHHLNSSQAACLNLFWPLLHSCRSKVVTKALEIDTNVVSNWEFEKVVNRNEGTNFDLYLELQTHAKVYVEFKYTETNFGSGKCDSNHLDKLKQIYRPALKDKVAPEYLEAKMFFKHYQLLRNLTYFKPAEGDYVLFVFPEANRQLAGVSKDLDRVIPDSRIRSHVRVRHLEDVVSAARAALFPGDHRLHAHLMMYEEKYLRFEKERI